MTSQDGNLQVDKPMELLCFISELVIKFTDYTAMFTDVSVYIRMAGNVFIA